MNDFLIGAHVFQITPTKTYCVANLLEDIKGLYKLTGIKGQKVTAPMIRETVNPTFSN
jgi:hypothetical protein